MARTLKNESKRKFQFGSDYKNPKFFNPGDVAVFDDAVAERLLIEPGVVDINNYKVAFDDTKVVDHSEAEKPAVKKPKDKKAPPSDDALVGAM